MKRKTMFKTGDILELTYKSATDSTSTLTNRAIILRTFIDEDEGVISAAYMVYAEPMEWEEINDLARNGAAELVNDTVLKGLNAKKIGHIDLSKWINKK